MEYKSSKLFHVYLYTIHVFSTLDLYKVNLICMHGKHACVKSCTCMHGDVHFSSFLSACMHNLLYEAEQNNK